MTLAQTRWLRRELHGRLEGRATLIGRSQMLVAAARSRGRLRRLVRARCRRSGIGLVAQIVSVGVAIVVGLVVYAGAVLALGIRRRARSSASSWDGWLEAVNGRISADERLRSISGPGLSDADTAPVCG